MTPRRLIEPARLAGTALLHTQSDERLVDLTRAGNGRAFETIVSRYRKQLLRYCSGLLPSSRAEDAVQQTFLNAYKGITEGEAELKLKPWLYKIAHNASLNLLRQNGWNYDQIPEDFDGVMQPPQAVEQSERIRDVIRGVQGLPDRQRDAIVLRELEGRSYEEIGVALGVTDGAVRQLLNRARTTLRAAATAVTPPQLLERLAERGGADTPTLSRIAEVAAGAGGVAGLAKAGTALVVAGAVAGGVVAGPLDPSRDGGPNAVAEAAQIATAGVGGADDDDGDGVLGREAGDRRGGPDVLDRAIELARQERERERRHSEPGDDHGGRDEPGDDGDRRGREGGDDADHSGPGSGGDDGGDRSGPGGGGDDGIDDRSGSGDGSSSGPGGGDDGGDFGSGPGPADDGGSSGSGSGSSGSGSGTSGSGTSDSSGSGSSGSGSSGSGSSGSGSGDDGLPKLDDNSGPS
jgi:RNA polymerase sigma factor (sigma-70 family)